MLLERRPSIDTGQIHNTEITNRAFERQWHMRLASMRILRTDERRVLWVEGALLSRLLHRAAKSQTHKITILPPDFHGRGRLLHCGENTDWGRWAGKRWTAENRVIRSFTMCTARLSSFWRPYEYEGGCSERGETRKKENTSNTLE
jgi:hypothetical protein